MKTALFDSVHKRTDREESVSDNKQRKLIPPKLVLAFKPSAVLKEKMK